MLRRWLSFVLAALAAESRGQGSLPRNQHDAPQQSAPLAAAKQARSLQGAAVLRQPEAMSVGVRPGTETLATYLDHRYAGKAAATTRRLGRGTVTMIGVWTDDGELEREIVRLVYRRAQVAIEDLPPGAFMEWRDGLYVAVNYNPVPVPIPLPANAEVIRGTMPPAPAGVLVWRER